MHTHVFNGSDLQIGAFFKWILARNNKAASEWGDLLQELGRDFAPTAAEEMVALQDVESALRSCQSKAFLQVLDLHRQSNYDNFRAKLNDALDRTLAKRSLRGVTISPRLRSRIKTLPSNHAAFRESPRQRRRLRLSAAEANFEGLLEFAYRNFQFRYVNVYDYLIEYSTGRERKIDLLVAHLVDFDWPIARGTGTTTGLRDQIMVMERISRLTGGRVLCFAPFDPFKQVATG